MEHVPIGVDFDAYEAPRIDFAKQDVTHLKSRELMFVMESIVRSCLFQARADYDYPYTYPGEIQSLRSDPGSWNYSKVKVEMQDYIGSDDHPEARMTVAGAIVERIAPWITEYDDAFGSGDHGDDEELRCPAYAALTEKLFVVIESTYWMKDDPIFGYNEESMWNAKRDGL